MKVSTRGRYAIRLIIELAMINKEEYTPLSLVSQKQDISLKYLEQISSLLSKAGILQSIRGSHGGYKLAKAPANISVGDVLRITEGSLAPLECVTGDNCTRADQCATIDMWNGLYKVIKDYLDNITIADLLDNVKSKSGWEYII